MGQPYRPYCISNASSLRSYSKTHQTFTR